MTCNWWEALYDECLADVLLVRGDQVQLDRTVRFLVEKLNIRGDDRVFDQCCGVGSLSMPLARSGLSVVGVDQAESYIQRARKAAKDANVAAEFFVGDAFDFVPESPCDAVFNWWTSFGYAEDDESNQRMLHRAFEALKPGGRFLLDFMNLPGVLRGFQPHVVTRRTTPDGEVVLIRDTELDLASGFMRKEWTYFLPSGERKSTTSRLRLYMPNQIAELLLAAGFVNVELFGSVAGETLGPDSPRCIALATKEA
jgi:SAM-dependent methyltransferase